MSRKLHFRKLASAALAAFAIGCSTSVLKHDNSQEILKNEEFESALEVKELPPTEAMSAAAGLYVRLPGPDPVPGAFAKDPSAALAAPGAATSKPGAIVGKKPGKPNATTNADSNAAVTSAAGGGASASPSATSSANKGLEIAKPFGREPAIEDSEGFAGRRPVVDPYRVGEKVTLETSYFSVVAGDMTLEVRPFVNVNGRKSYRFAGTAVSSSVFAMFYAVDDWFETFVDFESMTPHSYALHVKESKQLRETRSIFDWSTNTASWWDKKIDSEGKVEEKRASWEILPFSQNVFTAAFYLRSFTLTPGKKIAFRIAHEKENLVMTTEVVRRERISTPAGEFNTVVLKPKIELNGVFKPVGDIYIWLTDDDRKLIVKVESKIKIGKIVAIAKRIQRGG